MPQQFPILNFEQANPLLTGIGYGADLYKKFKMNPLEIKQAQIANELNEQKQKQQSIYLQKYPELLAAELAKAKLEPEETKARTNLTKGQLKQLEQQLKFYPEQFKSDMALRNAQIKEQESLAGLHGQQTQKESMLMNQFKDMFGSNERLQQQEMTEPDKYKNIQGNYGIEQPKPTKEDMFNKMFLGTDTFTPKLQNAMKQYQEQEKEYRTKLSNTNNQLETTRNFNNLVDKYDYYMDKAYTTGPIAGRIFPSWGPDAQQAQTIINQMTPEAVSELRAAMKGGNFAVADLNAALRTKPEITWNEKQRKEYVASRHAISDRLNQQRQFMSIAKDMKIPNDVADSAWQLYQDQYRVFDKTGSKVIQRKGDEWKQYLTLEALHQIQSTGSYNPINQSHITDQNIKDTMKATGKKRNEVLNILEGQGYEPQHEQGSFLKKLLNNPSSLPPGINVASGFISSIFPGEQSDVVANLPNIAVGKESEFSDKAAQEMGKLLFGIEAGGLPFAKHGAKGISNLTKKGKEYYKKAHEYVSPRKISEEVERFRSSLSGAKTESENIENLSKRVKFAEKSAKEEALPLKKELYSKEGKSNIYKIPTEQLPEGNLPKIAHEIEPGSELTKENQSALSNALKTFRKGKKDKNGEWIIKPGDTSHFIEKSEDIFGIPELSKKAESKIEDMLLLPTERNSKYFKNERITRLFDMDLKDLHKAYQKKPTLENYDSLQSAIKSEIRALKPEGKMNSKARRQIKELKNAVTDLNADKEAFMKTLPENMRELESKFREKWAKGAAKYSSESKLTLQRLASNEPGQLSQVTSNDIIRLFTKPNKNTLDVIKELGPSVGSNVIYASLNKIKPGDYDKMADAVLNLQNKRGFEGFVTQDMVNWAKQIKERAKKSSIVRKGLGTAAGVIGGSLAAGPIGGIAGGLIGAGSPFLKQYLEKIRPIKK